MKNDRTPHDGGIRIALNFSDAIKRALDTTPIDDADLKKWARKHPTKTKRRKRRKTSHR